MHNYKIGAMVESFRLDTFEAIKRASEIGVDGLQMYCSHGENAPENMSDSRKKDIIKVVKDSGLVFSAICGDLGHGFGDQEKNSALIEKSKRIIDLALELGTNIVTTHIGVVPSSPEIDRYKIMQSACFELAEYAEGQGARFAIETGPESSLTLKKFLDEISSSGIAVNLDPANLAMVIGESAVDAVHNLKDYIIHTHAKDGIKLFDMKPEYIYRVWETPEELMNKTAFKEVPLGEGSVNFPMYLKALDEIGYKGFLTIEREVGQDPEKDIRTAYSFLKDIIANG